MRIFVDTLISAAVYSLRGGNTFKGMYVVKYSLSLLVNRLLISFVKVSVEIVVRMSRILVLLRNAFEIPMLRCKRGTWRTFALEVAFSEV